MASGISEALKAFPRSGLDTTADRRQSLENEVTSLFEQFRVPVLRYLFSRRIPVADAEEIAQEVFLALFQHLRKGKRRTNLPGWIFRVAHNLAVNGRLQAKRHAERFSDGPVEVVAAESGPGPEESLMAKQRQTRLLAVTRALPERDQCCLSLRAEGLRYREIAEVLGISLGAVAASLETSLSRLSRAEQT